jgi:hypothetical protein
VWEHFKNISSIIYLKINKVRIEELPRGSNSIFTSCIEKIFSRDFNDFSSQRPAVRIKFNV